MRIILNDYAKNYGEKFEAFQIGRRNTLQTRKVKKVLIFVIFLIILTHIMEFNAKTLEVSSGKKN